MSGNIVIDEIIQRLERRIEELSIIEHHGKLDVYQLMTLRELRKIRDDTK